MSYYTFEEYCRKRDVNEGLGRAIGTGIDWGASKLGKGAARLGNAAVSGLGHGIMSGGKRAGNVLMKGQEYNQLQKLANKASSAILSGDPQKFQAVSKEIVQSMMQQSSTPGAPPKEGPTTPSTYAQRKSPAPATV